MRKITDNVIEFEEMERIVYPDNDDWIEITHLEDLQKGKLIFRRRIKRMDNVKLSKLDKKYFSEE